MKEQANEHKMYPNSVELGLNEGFKHLPLSY